MAGQLLVRSYNVGCGDCIYVRIPDGAAEHFHILIDCGSKEGASSGVMRRALAHLKRNMLPPDAADATKKRLDLLVVTHRHEDHIKGLDPQDFRDVAVKNIWITASMNENHPQAKQALKLHALAEEAVEDIVRSRAALSPELRDIVGLYGVSNAAATKLVTEELPAAAGIEAEFVFAGKTSDEFGIDIEDTKIFVLGPEQDIDRFYLGEEADGTLQGFAAAAEDFRAASAPAESEPPTNISAADFRRLQSRLLSNGLAFAVGDTKIQNNCSVVLLIEWRQRRLLFVGDAEWDSGFREGKKNSSWNVMWKERRDLLDKPIDFLKVGHHGSHNATPWNRHAGADDEVNRIFNAILPEPEPGREPTAQCVVSTKRKQYDTIPDGELLAELGKRVANARNYLADFQAADPDFDPDAAIFNYSVMKNYSAQPTPREVGDKGWLDRPQPPRTDMESAGRGQDSMIDDVEFIDVEIEGA